MYKVKVKDRIGITTSVIPHRNGKYPVWFENTDVMEFINSNKVIFL